MGHCAKWRYEAPRHSGILASSFSQDFSRFLWRQHETMDDFGGFAINAGAFGV
jgi:hypothetical protein